MLIGSKPFPLLGFLVGWMMNSSLPRNNQSKKTAET